MTKWQPHEKQIIKAMHRDGATYHTMATRVRRSYGSVKSCVHQLLKRGELEPNKICKPWNDRELYQLATMHRDGLTHNAMALELERTRSSISGKLHELITNNEITARILDYSEPDPCGLLDSEPCLYVPGSLEKIECMRARLERGVELWHPDDETLCTRMDD